MCEVTGALLVVCLICMVVIAIAIAAACISTCIMAARADENARRLWARWEMDGTYDKGDKNAD